MHQAPERDWTIEQLANKAALSRSVFFDRFRREVGMAPMAHLQSWRMALAKNLLRRREGGIKEIAERVGYGSTSAFSVSFTGLRACRRRNMPGRLRGSAGRPVTLTVRPIAFQPVLARC
ncbi:MAG: helix-turn-helix transcriptional regulator [Candidatus Devosia euplotis]|nr:helix-turn-helix transcriptional regulator [Candidatus Devosia euplotis]